MSNKAKKSENTEKTVVKRGRKRIEDGGKASPRKIYCSCAAVVDGALIHERVECTLGNDAKDEELMAEAAQLFAEKHGVEAESVDAPFFPRVGVKANTKKRESVDVDMESVVFTAGVSAGSAVYKDWNVTVRKIENSGDAVFITYKSHVTEEKKTKPHAKVVPVASLSNYVEGSIQA